MRVCGAACRLDPLGCERALMLSMCCAKACRTRTMSRNQPAVGRRVGPIRGDTGAVTSRIRRPRAMRRRYATGPTSSYQGLAT